jgi:hypothetical protein
MPNETSQGQSHTQGTPCAASCGDIVSERNRYYTGKYMTARDFNDEQAYFLTRQRLHTRLLHGWGIVCGLEVMHHSDPECAKRWVTINAGIAIDCCGRELVVPKTLYYELPLPPEKPAATDEQTGLATGSEAAMHGPFLLGLCYHEDEIERVPALFAEGACDPKRQEANRVREGVQVMVRRMDQVEGTCWLSPNTAGEPPCRDDCGDGETGTIACLEPSCPCGDFVPLARIHLRHDEHDYAKGFAIDTQGRRKMRVGPDLLTHIVSINWEHGGAISLSHLRGKMERKLRVRFDRKLHPAQGDRTGINAHTFVVQYSNIQEALEYLPWEENMPPSLDDTGCEAVFTIDERFLHRRGESIVDNIIHITLRCDFILDCHNNAVDGNFLGGRLPTGDKVPGGTFESWFRVVPPERTEEE